MIVTDTRLELKSKIKIYKSYIFSTKKKNLRQIILQDVKEKVKKHHLSEYWNFSDREAGGNALRYGKPPFRIKLYIATDGYLLTIQDSGAGFNVSRVMELMSKNQKYWHNKVRKIHKNAIEKRGTGFQYFSSDKVIISFENHGRNINLLKNHQTKGKTRPCRAIGTVGKSAVAAAQKEKDVTGAKPNGGNAPQKEAESSPPSRRYERRLRRTRSRAFSRRERKKKRTYVEDLPTFPDLAFSNGNKPKSSPVTTTKKDVCPHCGEHLGNLEGNLS